MDKNKLVIVVLAIVIIALAIGIFATMSGHTKQDTKVIIRCNSTLHEGEAVYVKLMDLNKTPIANQTVNVTIRDKDNANSSYSVLTNAKGIGKLKLDKVVGNYSINCTYGGNEKYNGNSTVKDITIEKEVAETQTASSSQSSDSSDSSGDTSSYTYSPQNQRYIRDDGEWSSSSNGDQVYQYKGDDGVIYEKYYDSSGKEISANEHYK